MPEEVVLPPMVHEKYTAQGFDCLLVKRGFGGRLGRPGMDVWWCGYVRIPENKEKDRTHWYILPVNEIVETTFHKLHSRERSAWSDPELQTMPYGWWIGFDLAHGMHFGSKQEAKNTILKIVVMLLTHYPHPLPEYPKIVRGRVHLEKKKPKRRRRKS